MSVHVCNDCEIVISASYWHLGDTIAFKTRGRHSRSATLAKKASEHHTKSFNCIN